MVHYKNISQEARQLLLSLGKLKTADKPKLCDDTGFFPSLVARKLRELIAKKAIKEKGGIYSLTEKGQEAFSTLSTQH